MTRSGEIPDWTPVDTLSTVVAKFTAPVSDDEAKSHLRALDLIKYYSAIEVQYVEVRGSLLVLFVTDGTQERARETLQGLNLKSVEIQ